MDLAQQAPEKAPEKTPETAPLPPLPEPAPDITIPAAPCYCCPDITRWDP